MGMGLHTAAQQFGHQGGIVILVADLNSEKRGQVVNYA